MGTQPRPVELADTLLALPQGHRFARHGGPGLAPAGTSNPRVTVADARVCERWHRTSHR